MRVNRAAEGPKRLQCSLTYALTYALRTITLFVPEYGERLSHVRVWFHAS